MDSFKIQLENLKQMIQNQSLTPQEPGFIVASSFLSSFENNSIHDSPPTPVRNKGLLKQKQIKKGLESPKDFIVVSFEVWSFIQENYKGGPEIKVSVLPDGKPELYPLRVTVRNKKINKSFEVSRAKKMTEFKEQIISIFSFPSTSEIRLTKQGDMTLIPFSENVYIGDVIKDNDPRFVVEEEDQKEASESKEGTTFFNDDLSQNSRKKKTGNQQHSKGKQQNNRKNKNNSGNNNNSNNRSNNSEEYAAQKFGTKPPGLRNLGNTCYMNSSLQCLLSLPLFVDSLSEIVESAKKSPDVLTSFERFSHNYDPAVMKKIMSDKIPFFKGNGQHDSHEFTLFFVDLIHDENPEKISELFYGKMESITTCAKCGHKSVVNEFFSSLQLSISSARRVLYVPYSIDLPLSQLVRLPKNNCVVIGESQNGLKYIDELSPEYTDVTALEIPPNFTTGSGDHANKGLALILMRTKKNIAIMPPMICEVPLNDETVDINTIHEIVWERIQGLWASSKRSMISFEIEFEGNSFTLSPKELMCNEVINVVFNDCMIDRKHGYKNRITSIVDTDLTLDELIDAYFTESQLDMENKWECDGCKEKSCAYQKFKLLSLPQILVLQLKRFTAKRRSERDNSKISIPEKIEFENLGFDDKFELCSVSYHLGSLECGHYIADGKRKNINNDMCWYQFNDGSVSNTVPPTKPSSGAYLLFYQKACKGQEKDAICDKDTINESETIDENENIDENKSLNEE